MGLPTLDVWVGGRVIGPAPGRATTRVCPYGERGSTSPQIHALGASPTSRSLGMTVMQRSHQGRGDRTPPGRLRGWIHAIGALTARTGSGMTRGVRGMRLGGGEEVAGVVDHHLVYCVLGDAHFSEEGNDVTVDEEVAVCVAGFAFGDFLLAGTGDGH